MTTILKLTTNRVCITAALLGLMLMLTGDVRAEETAAAAEAAPATTHLSDVLRGEVDALWTCIAAFLVFFMQAGFALVECGFTRAKNACNIMMKNLMDLSIGSLAFWIIGFGLMFGATQGFIGTNGFLYEGGFEEAKMVDGEVVLSETATTFDWAFLIFQTVFAATAATIVSGAMAERTKFGSYLIFSVFICVIVYPIFGGWCWSGLVGGTGSGWLEADSAFMTSVFGEGIGFLDFAGSTVVHSVGGWAALAGAIVLGARLGKFGKDGKINPIPGHNITLAALGVFILWLGWFGFNAGSTTSVGGGLFARIAVTTNLAAASGAIGAMLTSWIKFKKPDPSFALNGALAGLVGITAGCDVLSPVFAALTGLIAGVIVVASVMFFEKLRIDDPVGAISVHGVCGAWGTLAVGLFMPGGLLLGGTATQLMVQLVGIGACFLWAFPVSLAFFYAIKVTIGLRVSEAEEREGLDITEHGLYAYPPIMVADTMPGSPVPALAPVATGHGTAAAPVPRPEGA